jgi:hypothetical protein
MLSPGCCALVQENSFSSLITMRIRLGCSVTMREQLYKSHMRRLKYFQ